MKVIKRDGRAVDYDKAKIELAIEKANKEVKGKEKVTKSEIKNITTYIEGLEKKRILVEDIQDIIEQKLMEIDKYELAKKYIVYRYTRALVRKANTTDESILGIIRNENQNFSGEKSESNILIASMQRDYISCEVSRDLTKRLLLPEKIVKAHQEGILYFHSSDYFVHPMINSCFINIADMLENGIVINGTLIKEPETFQTACIVVGQIIEIIANNQYGEQYIDLKFLGKYLRKSYEKLKKHLIEQIKNKLSEEMIEEIAQKTLNDELKQSLKAIQYQINTLKIISSKTSSVTLFLNIQEDDMYIQENVMIIEELINQTYKGAIDELDTYVMPQVPKLVYVINKCNDLQTKPYYYLTELVLECCKQQKHIKYISEKEMKEIYKLGTFNQGVVSINLPQIAILADGDESKFWELLNERLELCFEALMCRHYALLGTLSDISPIHWQYGAIAHLTKGEKIDKLLYGEYSTISLRYIGINEMLKLVRDMFQTEQEINDFSVKIIQHIKNIVNKWKKHTNIGFVLEDTILEEAGCNFAKIDKQRFGTIKDVTDKRHYTNVTNTKTK